MNYLIVIAVGLFLLCFLRARFLLNERPESGLRKDWFERKMEELDDV